MKRKDVWSHVFASEGVREERVQTHVRMRKSAMRGITFPEVFARRLQDSISRSSMLARLSQPPVTMLVMVECLLHLVSAARSERGLTAWECGPRCDFTAQVSQLVLERFYFLDPPLHFQWVTPSFVYYHS